MSAKTVIFGLAVLVVISWSATMACIGLFYSDIDFRVVLLLTLAASPWFFLAVHMRHTEDGAEQGIAIQKAVDAYLGKFGSLVGWSGLATLLAGTLYVAFYLPEEAAKLALEKADLSKLVVEKQNMEASLTVLQDDVKRLQGIADEGTAIAGLQRLADQLKDVTGSEDGKKFNQLMSALEQNVLTAVKLGEVTRLTKEMVIAGARTDRTLVGEIRHLTEVVEALTQREGNSVAESERIPGIYSALKIKDNEFGKIDEMSAKANSLLETLGGLEIRPSADDAVDARPVSDTEAP